MLNSKSGMVIYGSTAHYKWLDILIYEKVQGMSTDYQCAC